MNRKLLIAAIAVVIIIVGAFALSNNTSTQVGPEFLSLSYFSVSEAIFPAETVKPDIARVDITTITSKDNPADLMYSESK